MIFADVLAARQECQFQIAGVRIEEHLCRPASATIIDLLIRAHLPGIGGTLRIEPQGHRLFDDQTMLHPPSRPRPAPAP